jgi:hypothetical protein
MSHFKRNYEKGPDLGLYVLKFTVKLEPMAYIDKLHKLPVSRSGDRSPRIAVATAVKISAPDGRTIGIGKSVNLSRTGALVSLPGTIPAAWSKGQKVHLLISSEFSYVEHDIALEAAVVRIEPPTADSPHVCLAFTFLKEVG